MVAELLRAIHSLLCELRDLWARELGGPGARWDPNVPPLRLMIDTTTGNYVNIKDRMPGQRPAARGYLLNTGTANLVGRVECPGGTSRPFTLVPNLPEPITYNLIGIAYVATAKTALEVKAQ